MSTAQESGSKEAAVEVAQPNAPVTELPSPEFTLKVQQADAISGFKPVGENWMDDTEEDDDLPFQTVAIAAQDATIATANACTLVEAAEGVQPPTKIEETVKVIPGLGAVGTPKADHLRRVSASSDESRATTITPPTSPELYSEDDCDSICADAEDDSHQQPPCSQGLVESSSAYPNDVDLDEEYESHHDRTFYIDVVESNATRPTASLDANEAAMALSTAPSTSFMLGGLQHQDATPVLIPGLSLINGAVISPELSSITRTEVQSQKLIKPALPAAPTTTQHTGRLFVHHAQRVVSRIPGPLPDPRYANRPPLPEWCSDYDPSWTSFGLGTFPSNVLRQTPFTTGWVAKEICTNPGNDKRGIRAC